MDKFSKIFIGMEFRDDSLVVSCIKNELSGMRFISTSTFPFRKDDETIGEIKSFFAENVRGPREVFVTIPYSWAVVKFIEVPAPKAKGKDALSHMMKFEIERHIPFPVEEVLCDFQVVSRTKSTYHLIVVAVRKNKIADIQEFIESLSLRTDTITLSPFAVLNCIELSDLSIASWQNLIGFSKKQTTFGKSGEVFASIFIDSASVLFTLFSGGRCFDLRSTAIDRGTSGEEIADAIASSASAAMQEHSLPGIDRILLSGIPPQLKDISNAVHEKTGVPVRIVNPVAKFVQGTETPETLQLTPSIGVCYSGLDAGTFHINLLEHKSESVFQRTGAIISKVSIPLILILIIGIFAVDILNEKRLLSRIEEKIEENQPDIKIIENFTSEIAILRQKQDFLRDVRESNIVLEILSELTGLIPVDTWLSNFHFKSKTDDKGRPSQGELTISGFAQSSSILISLIEDSPFFERVEFVGPIKKRRGMEEFKIKIDTVLPDTEDEEQVRTNGDTAEPETGGEERVGTNGDTVEPESGGEERVGTNGDTVEAETGGEEEKDEAPSEGVPEQE